MSRTQIVVACTRLGENSVPSAMTEGSTPPTPMPEPMRNRRKVVRSVAYIVSRLNIASTRQPTTMVRLRPKRSPRMPSSTAPSMRPRLPAPKTRPIAPRGMPQALMMAGAAKPGACASNPSTNMARSRSAPSMIWNGPSCWRSITWLISMILASGIVFPFERGAPPTPTPPRRGEGNLFVGDVEPVAVRVGHLKFARRARLQEIAAHIGFLAAAERHGREIGIGARDFGDMFLEGVEVFDVEAHMVRPRTLDGHAFDDGDRPGHDGKRHPPVGQMIAGRLAFSVHRLQLEHVSVEFGALFGVGRADGEFVEIAVLRPAIGGLFLVEVDAGVVLLLREIEDVAVGIMAAIGGEGARRRALHDVGFSVLLLHALQYGFDIVPHHSQMVDAAYITVATRDDLHADIAIGVDRRIDDAEAGIFQSEHRLVEFPEHRVLMADDGGMVDLSEHSCLQKIYAAEVSPSCHGAGSCGFG